MTLSAAPARQGKVGNCDCKRGQEDCKKKGKDKIVKKVQDCKKGKDKIVKKVDRTVKNVKTGL